MGAITKTSLRGEQGWFAASIHLWGKAEHIAAQMLSLAELRFKSEGYPQGLIGSVSTVPSAFHTDFTALNKSLGLEWLILPGLQRQESNYTSDLLQESP